MESFDYSSSGKCLYPINAEQHGKFDLDKASPHTIMKFKLVEEYIKAWAQKLMLNSSCYGLVFIDCMCNSGVYTYNGETVEGTPVRVAKVLLDVARSYPQKQVQIYLNDNSQEKVDELKKR